MGTPVDKSSRVPGPSHEGLTDGKHLRARPDKVAKKKRRGFNSTLPAVGPKHAEKRAERFGLQAEACRKLPCFRCGLEGASAPHHEPPGGGDADTIPLCDRTRLNGADGCHQLRHDQGYYSFWTSVGFTPEQAQDLVRVQMAKGPIRAVDVGGSDA